MTPFEIEILLHYYAKAGDCAICLNDQVPWRSCRDTLIRSELLKWGGPEASPKYAITDRGRAYVEGLIQVPLPERSGWKIPWPKGE